MGVGHCAGVLLSFPQVVSEAINREKVLAQFGNGLSQDEFDVLANGEEVRDLGLCSESDSISRAEFCLYMLVKLGRVEEEELRAVQDVFDVYDVTKSGSLNKADITEEGPEEVNAVTENVSLLSILSSDVMTGSGSLRAAIPSLDSQFSLPKS